jgi:cytochrome P450
MEKKIPSTQSFHFFGNHGALRSDTLGYIHQTSRELGHFFKIRAAVFPVHITTDPVVAQHLLQKNNKNYGKGRGYRVMAEFLGEGLLTSEGAHWLKHRRIMQPAFHKARLQALAQTMLDYTNASLATQPADAVIDVNQWMSALTMHIAAGTLFSSDVGEDIDNIYHSFSEINAFGISMIRQPLRFLFSKVFKSLRSNFDRNAAVMDAIIYRIIRERQLHPETKHNDLLALLMDARDEESGDPLSEQELRDEIITLFLAGHETSANAMTWMLYLLAQHPDKLEKLKNAVTQTTQGQPFDVQHIYQCPYLHQVIHETLRLYPPAWTIGRRALGPDNVDGYEIKAGDNIMIVVQQIHRREDLWPQPDAFIPERFEADKMKQIPPYAYFPFGGGPRLCIGEHFAMMEMSLILGRLVQEFTWTLEESSRGVKPQTLITLRPDRPIRIRLQKSGS